MRIHRGHIAQHKHDQLLREYLKQHLNELIQQKELIIDGKVKTQIATLDLPTLKYGEDTPVLARGTGRGGKGGGGGSGQVGDDEIQVLAGMLGGDHHGREVKVELDFDEFVRLAQEVLLQEIQLPVFHEQSRSGEVYTDDHSDLDDLDRNGLRLYTNIEVTMSELLLKDCVA